MGIGAFRQTNRRYSQAKETGVEAGELRSSAFYVKHVLKKQFSNFCVRLSRGPPTNDHDFFYAFIAQTFSKHCLAHHSSGAEKNYVHDVLL
jgi:hypothetical protein